MYMQNCLRSLAMVECIRGIQKERVQNFAAELIKGENS